MRAPDRTPGGWWWHPPEPKLLVAPAAPGVHVEDNPVVATLFGPAGEVISEARSHRVIEFGYRAHAHEGDIR